MRKSKNVQEFLKFQEDIQIKMYKLHKLVEEIYLDLGKHDRWFYNEFNLVKKPIRKPRKK